MITYLAALALAFSLPGAPMRHPVFSPSGLPFDAAGLCGFAGTTSDPGPIYCSLLGSVNLIAGTGTAGSGTGITISNNGYIRPFVHKLVISRTALTAAGTTDLTVWTTGAVTRLIRVVAVVGTTFTGGGLTAVTFQCGSAAGGNQYLLAGSVFTAVTTLGDVAAEIGAGLTSATVADFGALSAGSPDAITISCRFTCTTANCSAATQGSLNLYIEGVAYP